MNEPDRLPTEQEIVERLLASRKKPKLIPKPTVRERVEQRFNPARKPTEAVLQDAIAHNNAVEQRFTDGEDWLAQELRKQAEALREFETEQLRLSNDPARSNHMAAAYRRAAEQDRLVNGPYYRLVGDYIQSTRDARAAIEASRIHYHRGPGED